MQKLREKLNAKTVGEDESARPQILQTPKILTYENV